jgi:hypothetical protein
MLKVYTFSDIELDRGSFLSFTISGMALANSIQEAAELILHEVLVSRSLDEEHAHHYEYDTELREQIIQEFNESVAQGALYEQPLEPTCFVKMLED